MAEREDELGLALGNEEHSGRIRGVPGGIGKKKYYGKSKTRYSKAEQEVVRLRAMVTTLEDRIQAIEKRVGTQLCSHCSQEEQVVIPQQVHDEEQVITPQQINPEEQVIPEAVDQRNTFPSSDADVMSSTRDSPPPMGPPEVIYEDNIYKIKDVHYLQLT